MKFTTCASSEPAGIKYSVKYCFSSGSIVTMLFQIPQRSSCRAYTVQVSLRGPFETESPYSNIRKMTMVMAGTVTAMIIMVTKV